MCVVEKRQAWTRVKKRVCVPAENLGVTLGMLPGGKRV